MSMFGTVGCQVVARSPTAIAFLGEFERPQVSTLYDLRLLTLFDWLVTGSPCLVVTVRSGREYLPHLLDVLILQRVEGVLDAQVRHRLD